MPGLIKPLIESTRAVLTSQDPLRTNFDVFFAAMTPALTMDRAEFDRVVQAFYQTAYTTLREHTAVRPAARRLVEWLLERGYRVVVATNPFFPRVAIEQRLAWAGVPVDEVGFELVTSLENMHFSKPHPHYYEEILARVGVSADEAIMVGDDWGNDITPAWRAGLNTYWTGGDTAPAGEIVPDGCGPFEDFARLVEQDGWLDHLTPRPLEPAQIIPRLSGSLAGLLGIAAEVPADAWEKRPAEGEWSPGEVFCHLDNVERLLYQPWIGRICEEDNPLLTVDALPPAPVCSGEVTGALADFGAARLETIAFLAGLDMDAWQRPARFKGEDITLLIRCDRIARHDRNHIGQIRAAVDTSF